MKKLAAVEILLIVIFSVCISLLPGYATKAIAIASTTALATLVQSFLVPVAIPRTEKIFCQYLTILEELFRSIKVIGLMAISIIVIAIILGVVEAPLLVFLIPGFLLGSLATALVLRLDSSRD